MFLKSVVNSKLTENLSFVTFVKNREKPKNLVKKVGKNRQSIIFMPIMCLIIDKNGNFE